MPPDLGVGWTDPDQEAAVPEYRKTKAVGVYVRHQMRCPAARADERRCRCQPSYRGRRWIRVEDGWCGRTRSRNERRF